MALGASYILWLRYIIFIALGIMLIVLFFFTIKLIKEKIKFYKIKNSLEENKSKLS